MSNATNPPGRGRFVTPCRRSGDRPHPPPSKAKNALQQPRAPRSSNRVRQNPRAMTILAILFWVCVGLLVYAHLGYPLLLVALARVRHRAPAAPIGTPDVSVIVPAYAEQEVISQRVKNLRSLRYPPERLEVIVACDGSPDETAARARAAGADLVLELPRGGKIRAQDAAVQRARRRSSRSRTPTRCWEPEALTGAGGAVRRRARRLRVRRRSRSSTSAVPTRRGSTGATRWRCGRSSPGSGR